MLKQEEKLRTKRQVEFLFELEWNPLEMVRTEGIIFLSV